MRRFVLFLALIGVVMSAGCAGSHRGGKLGTEARLSERGQVTANAYLFDAKLRQRGKLSSIRLELLRTDSVVSIAGRGYLGKGALRGRLTADSLIVYFPISNEYVREDVRDLLNATICTAGNSSVNLLAVLEALPDAMPFDSTVQVISDRTMASRPVYTLSRLGCTWQLQLTYDRKGKTWRVAEFDFTNGSTISFRGRRREIREDVSVPSDRFEVPIPDDAARLRPERN